MLTPLLLLTACAAAGCAWAALQWLGVRARAADAALARLGGLLRERDARVPALIDLADRHLAEDPEAAEPLRRLCSQGGSLGLSAEPEADEVVEREGRIAHLVAALCARLEAEPELKTDSELQKLQQAIVGLEEPLAAGRGAYNDAATAYNQLVVTAPVAWLAAAVGWNRRALFPVTRGARQPMRMRELLGGRDSFTP